jgi:hypothetical protein
MIRPNNENRQTFGCIQAISIYNNFDINKDILNLIAVLNFSFIQLSVDILYDYVYSILKIHPSSLPQGVLPVGSGYMECLCSLLDSI